MKLDLEIILVVVLVTATIAFLAWLEWHSRRNSQPNQNDALPQMAGPIKATPGADGAGTRQEKGNHRVNH